MKVSELKAILVSCPDDAEVFLDFPTGRILDGPAEKIARHFDADSCDSFSMSIDEVSTSWGDNDKVVTIIPDEIVRC